MADKSIKITIATALNASGFTAARRAISNLVSGTADFAKKVGGNLMNIKAGFDMVAGAASKLMQAMSKGMEFERMTVAFKSLTGSMELAKAHMKDLQDLGRTPPFSLEQFAAASQAMMKMTGGMAGFRNEMAIVGDMAAATGNDIATVGRAFGLAYQVIRDGQDFGRAGQQLYSLGIMTKKQVADFAEMSKAGTDNMAVWKKLMDAFGRYNGAMEATEKTAKGLTEAIQGEAQVAITDFSTAITETAKPALEGLLGYMKRVNEDGTIEEWADASVENLNMVASAMKGLGSVVSSIWTGIKATIGTAMAFGAGADEEWRNGGKSLNMWSGLKNQVKAGYSVAKEYWRSEVSGSDDDEENRQLTRKDRAEAKAKMRSAERVKAEAEAEKRIREDMAKAQAATTAKFEAEKQKAIDETMAKLREMAGMDADVDVAVNVEEPKPIKPKVIQPDSVDVKVNSPSPVKVDVTKPDPVDVKVSEPDAVDVKVNQPKPVDVKVVKPDAVSVDVKKPDAVKIDVVKPAPATVKAKVVIDDDGFAALENRMKTIPELIKPDMSGVKKALAELASARTEEELKAAKAAVDTAMKKQKADDEAFKNLQTKMREADKNAAEFVAAYEKDQEEAAKKAAKQEADEKMKAMKELHDARMKQLDKEAEKVKKQIDDAKAKGFDNVMATAGGGFWDNGTLDQAGDIRAERQKKIGEDRAQKAEDALKKKMEKLGATLDDPSKLGRMSNLERAAFERLKLKEAEANAAKIQKEKEDREKQIVKDLDAIKKQLQDVGL